MGKDNTSKDLIADKAIALIRPGGAISRLLRGFESREAQEQMMKNIIEAYREHGIALIEAGTGTGKSIACLIPAILWAIENKERTLISTNTINLQEQLLYKDIPLVVKAIGIPIQATLVKGMSNYLCLRKLNDLKYEMRLIPDQESDEIGQIRDWSAKTADGTISDIPFIPMHSTWEKVCAESDTCSKKQCPFYKECYFFKARKHAESAQILVSNHSMFFADLVYSATNTGDDQDDKKEGLLPQYNHVILDEAHNIEDVATDFFADKVSYIHMLKTINRLGSDAAGKLSVLESYLRKPFKKDIPSEISRILERITGEIAGTRRDLQILLRDTFDLFPIYMQHVNNPENSFSTTSLNHENKLRMLSNNYSDTKWKENIHPLADELVNTANRYVQMIHNLDKDLKHLQKDKIIELSDGMRQEIIALANRISEGASVVRTFIQEQIPPNVVRWMEAKHLKTMTNVQLTSADLNISQKLVEAVFSKFHTVILLSATMTTNNNFKYLKKRLGITKENLPDKLITENIYQSPFDYHNNSLLVIPRDMPSPDAAEFNEAACERIWDAVTASRGNAFILFTSYSMLTQCYEILAPRLKERKFVPFKQGDASRKVLLEQFKNTDQSVLFGTDSFWEGVDVSGEALRCVIIPKLPFKVPTEPIIQARTESIKNEGGSPFFDYSVPKAIVKFKQGFGRLIRNKTDRGCIVCLDNRLITKGYGTIFLKSLPPSQRLVIDGSEVYEKMSEFYRKTYHLTKSC